MHSFVERPSSMNKKQKRMLRRIIVALVLFALAMIVSETGLLRQWFGSAALWAEFVAFLIPYLVAGYDVLIRAAKNIAHGQVFDENFLMAVATVGAFALVLFPNTDPHMSEGAAVMLFYQVGELFQGYAVGKSRASIAAMMDIAPDYATVMHNGELCQVDPNEVSVGDEIVVKPGERVPLDGVVVEGTSQLDTAALTGESVPRSVEPGGEVVSGCVNMTGVLTVRVTKPFGESTVSRILELVENASAKKAKAENFITRFARYYTPAVVIVALLLAVVPPFITGDSFATWIERGLVFLVVSCPCALVISIPLSFFGGIGGASRLGILVKGGNYLEALAKVDTVVFDKTGTLTSGTFEVVAVHPEPNVDPNYLLRIAAHAESFSDHPIAASVRAAYSGAVDTAAVQQAHEKSGRGVTAVVEGVPAAVGNGTLMAEQRVELAERVAACVHAGTVLHVAVGGTYLGHIEISDVPKEDSAQAVADLHRCGVAKIVMLTGDREPVAQAVAKQLGIDEYRAGLLPQDKVAEVERLLSQEREGHKLAFVGDGINDAPVLTRADVGIAMGALGSDAAIEAADVVLMDDRPSNIAKAIAIARKTMAIVRQNIVFALGVKFAVLVLAAVGIANMWLAVFADVGVAILAILNAMRCMNVKKL